MEFSVGDRVKYTYEDGEVIYGIINEIGDKNSCYRYHVIYDEGSRCDYDWECGDDIELVATKAEMDYEKFKDWMTKLAKIDKNDPDALEAFDRYYSTDSYTYGNHSLDEDIAIFWNYINKSEVKEMTLEEIEAELGYKIRIKE